MLNNISIKEKLYYSVILVALITTLLFFTVLYFINDGHRSNFVTTHQNHMKVLSQDFTRLITIGSPDTAADISSRLKGFPAIKYVVLYNSNGNVVYIYNENRDIDTPPPKMSNIHYNFGDQYLKVLLPVSYFDTIYGYSYLEISTEDYAKSINEFKMALALAFLPVVAVFVIFLTVLSHYVVNPIVNLSTFLSKIKSNNINDEIIHTNQKDEVGDLFNGVNKLITEVGKSQADLESANRNLELRVNKRTEELKTAMVKSEAASKSKSLFLANMSHEIRTPMNGILGMLDLLKMGDLDVKQEENLTVAANSAETLLTILNDILDFSKIEAGKLELEFVNFNIRSTIEDSVALFLNSANQNNIELNFLISNDFPGIVNGDPTRVRQILNNLIGNAIKFTENGEVFIDAKVEEQADEKVKVKIDIKDTGVGIDAEKVDHIFDSFAQEDNSTTRTFGGTGLGLSISKMLIDKMGGDITISSTKGKGSTFSVYIELGCVDEAENDKQFLPENMDSIHALIVDDNKTNIKVFSYYLASWGICYECAENGDEALNMLHANKHTSNPYNLILLDMMMPGMDGVQVIEQIKINSDEFNKVKIIVLSSSADTDMHISSIDKGANQCMTKPIRQSELYNAIANSFHHATADASEEIENNRKSTSESSPSYDINILLVEDNKINQKVAMGYLKTLGLKADLAMDGIKALEAMDEKQYDLVLMDCQMPVMDGFTATKEIRMRESKSESHVKIIAMTANSMKGDKEKCIIAGMDDYLSKPLKRETFKVMIEKWMAEVHDA